MYLLLDHPLDHRSSWPISSHFHSFFTSQDPIPAIVRRRMSSADIDANLIVIGSLRIRTSDSLVRMDDRPVTLTVREFGLLLALAQRNGGIVSRDELYRAVWGRRLRDGDRSVDVYIHKLRDKLEEAQPAWRYIHTHVGFGYRLSAEPTDAGDARSSQDLHILKTEK
ncbi:MAG TPA: response regulator transcription factor [Solirubrobacteraceae bacterium]